MPFKPNYRQARGERDRLKRQKKQEKLRKRDEDAAARKADTEPGENAPEVSADDAAAPDGAAAPDDDGSVA